MGLPTMHGLDLQAGRQLYSLLLPKPSDFPSSIELGSEHFVCFIAWNAATESVECISNLLKVLMRSGASYFVCWGENCERVHDIADEIEALPDGPFARDDDSCIMTTWHDNDTLEEALEFFLDSTKPDEPFVATTNASLAIVIGQSQWANAIEAALSRRGRANE